MWFIIHVYSIFLCIVIKNTSQMLYCTIVAFISACYSLMHPNWIWKHFFFLNSLHNNASIYAFFFKLYVSFILTNRQSKIFCNLVYFRTWYFCFLTNSFLRSEHIFKDSFSFSFALLLWNYDNFWKERKNDYRINQSYPTRWDL